MQELKHILLTTDFSDNSRSALPAAVALARKNGAELHLLHVAAPQDPVPAYRILVPEEVRELNEGVSRHCKAEMERLAAEVDSEVKCSTHVLMGQAAKEVKKFVAAHNIDLLVLSSMGRTGLKRLMIGSVAEKVVRTAPCPVLVVRSSPESWDKITKIIVPIDFSKLSKLAMREAVEMARPSGAQLLLVHVMQETDYPTGHALKGKGILDIGEQTRKSIHSHLDEIQSECVGSAVPSSVVVLDGVPAAAVALLVEEEKAELVVISTHGRAGLARFILGSTAERVVRLAPCSVLVVKERGA